MEGISMAYIAKSDYFAGIFLTTILKTAKTVPLLCDALSDVKCVVFDTDIGYFNVFVKYSTTLKDGWDNKNQHKTKRTYWNITFTYDEYSYLLNYFEEQNKKNLVAIVCTNEKFTGSKIAILTLEEAKKCLNTQTNGGQRRITVSRTGSEHNFDCFGVGASHDTTDIHPYVNHLRFFDNAIDDGEK